MIQYTLHIHFPSYSLPGSQVNTCYQHFVLNIYHFVLGMFKLLHYLIKSKWVVSIRLY